MADWMRQAVCVGMDPSIFEASGNEDFIDDRAVAACGSCPVANECLNHLLAYPIQVDFGARMTPSERRKIAKRRRRVPSAT